MKLKILVGTMTSTADFVAQSIQMEGDGQVEAVEVQLMDGLDISAFDDDALYLICSSTYGSGDVPDNARNLYESLDTQPKFLGHVRYGVIALGAGLILAWKWVLRRITLPEGTPQPMATRLKTTAKALSTPFTVVRGTGFESRVAEEATSIKGRVRATFKRGTPAEPVVSGRP